MSFASLITFIGLHHYILMDGESLEFMRWPQLTFTAFVLGNIVDQVVLTPQVALFMAMHVWSGITDELKFMQIFEVRELHRIGSFPFMMDFTVNALTLSILVIRLMIWLGTIADSDENYILVREKTFWRKFAA